MGRGREGWALRSSSREQKGGTSCEAIPPRVRLLWGPPSERVTLVKQTETQISWIAKRKSGQPDADNC